MATTTQITTGSDADRSTQAQRQSSTQTQESTSRPGQRTTTSLDGGQTSAQTLPQGIQLSWVIELVNPSGGGAC